MQLQYMPYYYSKKTGWQHWYYLIDLTPSDRVKISMVLDANPRKMESTLRLNRIDFYKLLYGIETLSKSVPINAANKDDFMEFADTLLKFSDDTQQWHTQMNQSPVTFVWYRFKLGIRYLLSFGQHEVTTSIVVSKIVNRR